jgi:hypothetical protein
MSQEVSIMKKALSICLVLLGVVLFAAPDLSAAVGVKGGLNFANFSLKTAEPPPFTFQNLQGPVVGLFFSLNLGFVGIQPEIYYSRRGTQYEEVDVGKLEYLLDYIEAPILLKLSVMPAGPIRPVLLAGPCFGYLVKATGKVTAEGTSVSEDVIDMFYRTSISAVFGGGIEFKLPGVMLVADVRYNLGLNNILKEADTGEYVKNKGFAVLVGIGF